MCYMEKLYLFDLEAVHILLSTYLDIHEYEDLNLNKISLLDLRLENCKVC